MNNLKLLVSTEFITTYCCVCGIVMAIPDDYNRQRMNDKKLFYCLNGHNQTYVGKTEAEKLREQLAQAEQKLQFERERASKNFKAREKAERKLKRAERRASGSVCPCCNRTFITLARHMRTKHPEFVEESK